jgi:hypothetical protein
LAEISRRKPILKNRVAPEVEAAVVELTTEQPAWGQVQGNGRMRRKMVRESWPSAPVSVSGRLTSGPGTDLHRYAGQSRLESADLMIRDAWLCSLRSGPNTVTMGVSDAMSATTLALRDRRRWLGY